MPIINANTLIFDEQAFLWDFLNLFPNLKSEKSLNAAQKKQIKKAVKTGGGVWRSAKINYPFILPLDTGRSESILFLNKLVGTGSAAVDSLSTAQASALVPKIELYKIIPSKSPKEKDKSYKFPFGDVTTLESILSSDQGRGTDGGIVSVTLQDTGKNPATAGLVFSGQINFHFASFESLWKERSVGSGEDKHDLAYVDILDQRSASGRRNKPKNEEVEASANPSNINAGDPKIRLVIGYSIPHDPGNVLGFRQTMVESLRSQQRSFIIKPLDQEMKFGPNGTVDMVFSFAASIEVAATGPRADLLAIDPNHPLVMNLRNTRSNAIRTARSRQNEFTAARAAAQARTEAVSAGEKESGAARDYYTVESKVRAGTYVASPQAKAALRALKQNVKYKKDAVAEARQSFDAAESELQSLSYARILGLIRKTLSEKDQDRIFHIDIKGGVIDEYKELNARALESHADVEEVEREERKEVREKFMKNKEQKLGELYTKIQKTSFTSQPASFAVDMLMDAETKGLKKDLGQKLLPGHYRLSFFYLGDLFNALMRVLYERPTVADKLGKGGKSNAKKLAFIKEDIRLIVGEVAFANPRTGRRSVMNLADIPVSLNYFNAWFFEHVIKSQRKHYSLRAFLGDFCTSFLNNVFSPGNLGAAWSLYRPKQTRIQPIWLPKGGKIDKSWRDENANKRLTFDEIFREFGKSAGGVNEYLVMYINGSENKSLDGDQDANIGNNIPHYFIGAESGPVLDISFSRTKIPGKLESRLADAANHQKGNLVFADRYDAQVKILGNPVLKPGMLIYIDPKAMGLRIRSKRISKKTAYWPADLGIGGYYRIIQVRHFLDSGQFRTELSTISEISTRQL